MQLDMKIYRRFLSLLVGVALLIIAFSNMLISYSNPGTISDQEIIQRAKSLGLVEMKDVYKDTTESNQLPNANNKNQDKGTK